MVRSSGKYYLFALISWKPLGARTSRSKRSAARKERSAGAAGGCHPRTEQTNRTGDFRPPEKSVSNCVGRAIGHAETQRPAASILLGKLYSIWRIGQSRRAAITARRSAAFDRQTRFSTQC